LFDYDKQYPLPPVTQQNKRLPDIDVQQPYVSRYITPQRPLLFNGYICPPPQGKANGSFPYLIEYRHKCSHCQEDRLQELTRISSTRSISTSSTLLPSCLHFAWSNTLIDYFSQLLYSAHSILSSPNISSYLSQQFLLPFFIMVDYDLL